MCGIVGPFIQKKQGKNFNFDCYSDSPLSVEIENQWPIFLIDTVFDRHCFRRYIKHKVSRYHFGTVKWNWFLFYPSASFSFCLLLFSIFVKIKEKQWKEIIRGRTKIKNLKSLKISIVFTRMTYFTSSVILYP